ncbi:MAG TPA: FAD-dependent oxidoreductase [Pyrinomonadaceae bacterium]
MPLNRRQFLYRSVVAAAGATLIKPDLLSYASVKSAPKKVLILGAGMAGLVAAYELTQLGHDVTILEARTRPGGRCHTIREPFSDGLFAEAGAARIPDNHDLTLKYAKLFNVGLEPMYPPQGSVLTFDNAGRRQGPTTDYTRALGAGFGGEMGGDPARWQKIKGGTDMLPKALAQRLANKIRYNSPVVKIDQDAKSARAVFLHGGTPETLSADRLLCTIPFSVLRNIELPQLSDRRLDVIKHARYAAVSRVYLQTRNRFWEEKGLNGFALPNNGLEIWQPTWSQPGPRGILMTYARPGIAERITNLQESERVSTTLDELEGMFPGLRSNFETAATKCWLEDEWSRGAWSFIGPREFVNNGGADEGGRIHFAGEHLSNTSSWIQGALQSGLRTVKEIDEAPV